MPSRRKSKNAIRPVLIVPEVFDHFRATYMARKSKPRLHSEIGLLCGEAKTKNGPYIQSAISIPPLPTTSIDGGDIPNGSNTNSRTGEIFPQALGIIVDDDFVRDFAYKIQRMLCGSSTVLGLYFVSSLENISRYMESLQSILRSITMDLISGISSLSIAYLITVPISTLEINMFSYDCSNVQNTSIPLSIPYKITKKTYVQTLVDIMTYWDVDMVFPIKYPMDSESPQSLCKVIEKAVNSEIAKIEASFVANMQTGLIINKYCDQSTLSSSPPANDSVVNSLVACPTHSDQKSRKNSDDHSLHLKRNNTKESFKAEDGEESTANDRKYPCQQYIILSRHAHVNSVNSFLTHQVVNGLLRMRGTISGRARVSPQHLDINAAQALKSDLKKSLQYRVDIILDSINATTLNQSIRTKNPNMRASTTISSPIYCELSVPQRLLLTIKRETLQNSLFCEYITEKDNIEMIRNRIAHRFNIPESDLEIEKIEDFDGQVMWPEDGWIPFIMPSTLAPLDKNNDPETGKSYRNLSWIIHFFLVLILSCIAYMCISRVQLNAFDTFKFGT